MANQSKIEKLTPGNLITAVIFLFIFSTIATACVLWLADEHLAYLSKVLKNWRFYTPAFILETVKRDMFKGLIMVLINQSVHLFIYVVAAIIFSYFISLSFFRYRLPARTKPKLQLASSYDAGAKKIDVLLKPNDKYVVTDLFKETYINLRRDPPKKNNKSRTSLGQFEIALLSILRAYRNWSCDPAGHHANVGLLQHSINVVKALNNLLPEESLSRTIGLAHDIGKILAYEQQTLQGQKVWRKKTLNHEQLSAQIIRMLPEFLVLQRSDKVIINSVLSFMHHPQSLPKYLADDRTFKLIKYLRIADGLATQQDQKIGQTNAKREDIIDAIGLIIPKLISGLNINQKIPDKHANGWTNPIYDFVAILEDSLRNNLKGLINIEMEEALSLNMPIKKGRTHPATLALYKALSERDYIFTEYKEIRPDHGLFHIMSGSIDFYGVFLFKREQLESILPEKLNEWGKSLYKIKIKS